ncbi:MAG: RimK family alpha-L-glutamate ligase [Clostridia bacterium]|nr:RimK family alpha-L-glutamate ligase [Clostridia bacterium]
MKIPIIINHSIPYFVASADDISEGIRKAGHTPIVLNNIEAREKIAKERFEKCIFLDKDIPLGLSMEISGTRLFNNIGSIELCSDKRRIDTFLRNDFTVPQTISYPLTYFPNEEFFAEFTEKVCDELGLPVIAKFANGSQGREVFLLNIKEEVLDFQRKNYIIPHLYQKFIASSKGKDMRVYVVGNKAVAAMIRENETDFRSNVAIGGTARKTEITDEINTLCTDVSNMLGLDFCGIDLLFTPDGFVVCEVNANALFAAMNEVCGIHTGHLIAEHAVNFKIGSL